MVHFSNTRCDYIPLGMTHHQQRAILTLLCMSKIMLDELNDMWVVVKSLEQLDLVHISLHRIMVAPAIG